MERHLFIVARDQRDLHEHLARAFASERSVTVIRDRRTGRERRGAAPGCSRPPIQAGGGERRSGDRRTRRYLDSQLALRGYAVLVLSDPL